jgi:hypothetical protein
MGIQYFDDVNFNSFFPLENNDFYEKISLVVTDSYNEEKIKESIFRIGIEECIAVSIQLAIVGYGQKTYGKFCFQEKEVDILSFFKKNNIKIDSTLGTKLDESDLTPGRIIRFCRFYIQKFIEKTGKESYLYKKYCLVKTNQEYRIKIFRGCEYLMVPGEDEEIVTGLVKTYLELDSRLNANITERIKRVLLAKGFTSPFLDSIKPFQS